MLLSGEALKHSSKLDGELLLISGHLGPWYGHPASHFPYLVFQNFILTGVQLITLLYEDNFFLFKPDVPADHEQYELRIQTRQCQFFGPFPHAYQDISTPDALVIVTYIMQSITPETYKPFARIIEREVSKMDKEFVLKLMKLDPRDRPSAEELLKDEWFQN